MPLFPDRPELLGGPVLRVDARSLTVVDGRAHLDAAPYTGIAFELGAGDGPVAGWQWYADGKAAGPVPDRYRGDPDLPWFHDDGLDDVDAPLDRYELGGEPCTGYVLAGDDGRVDQVIRCVDGWAVERIGIEDDGQVRTHHLDANGGRTADRDCLLSWYPSGRLQSARTGLLSRFGDQHEWCGLHLDLDDRGRVTMLADTGPYFDVANRAGGWGDAWIVPSPELLAPLGAAPELRLFHRLDRWWRAALEALASAGGLDEVAHLATDARSFAPDELAWLLAQPLPALRRLEISAGPYRDDVPGWFGDLFTAVAATKRARPGVQVRVGPIWLTAPGEARPPVEPHHAVGHLDPSCGSLVALDNPAALAGGDSANASDHLLEWLIAQPSLRTVEMGPVPAGRAPVAHWQRCVETLSNRRPDVALRGADGPDPASPPPDPRR